MQVSSGVDKCRCSEGSVLALECCLFLCVNWRRREIVLAVELNWVLSWHRDGFAV